MTKNQELKHLKNLVRISQEHINKFLAVENKIRNKIELLESTKNNPINK